jgi:cytosine/adenosine deaminase-related metal-dependent hydrolase
VLVETFGGAHSPLTSIHLMESAEERALFEEQGGPIRALYEALGLPWRPAPADHPLAHILPAVAATQPGLWVHVTDMTADELETLTTAHPHAWICLCPRSNVFLHDRLPDPIALMPYADRICLGTDSLASNTSLDMLEEIALLQTAWPDVSLHTLIRWATTGGASALQIPDRAGAFQPGTRPGVLHLSGTYGPDLTLGSDARAVRIF